MIPNILSIAGSDPSGGAGIQADIKAISANGGYAMAANHRPDGTETPKACKRCRWSRPDFVTQQIAALRADIRIDAVKIGMLGSAEMVNAVRLNAGTGLNVPVVLDPVMVAKGGDRLLQADAVAALRAVLIHGQRYHPKTCQKPATC